MNEVTFEKVKKKFESNIRNDKRYKALTNKTKKHLRNIDAFLYAELIADNYTSALLTVFEDAEIPNDFLFDANMVNVITSCLDDEFEYIATYSQNVQKDILKDIGANIQAVKTKKNKSRIENYANKLSNEEYKTVRTSLNGKIFDNFARSVVTDSIRDNCEVMENVGLTVFIKRDSLGGCCKWCSAMSGTYKYGEQPSDFFKAHTGCTCTWHTYTEKTVKTKMLFKTVKDEKGKMKLKREVTYY